MLGRVDESIDGFMAEHDRKVFFEVRADLFWAQAAREQHDNAGLDLAGELAVFTRIRSALTLAMEIPCPLVGVQIRAGPHVAPLLSADGGRITPERLGDLHIALAFAYGLMQIEPFLMAQMMIPFHGAIPLCECAG